MTTHRSRPDPLAGLPPDVRAQIREGYLDEATALADDLEAALLSLERQPEHAPTIDAAFRAAHTIKGSAAGVGCHAIADFTHGLEDGLESLRTHARQLSADGLAALLEGVDLIRALILSERTGAPAPETGACAGRIADAFQAGDATTTAPASADAEPAAGVASALADALAGLRSADLHLLQAHIDPHTALYRIQVVLPDLAFMLGLDPLALLGSLADEATVVQTAPLLDRVPAIDLIEPYTCYLGFAAIVATTGSADDLRAVFEFCPDGSIVEIQRIEPRDLASLAAARRDGDDPPEIRDGWKRLGELLVEEGLVRPDDLERVLARQSSLPGGGPAEDAGVASGDDGRTLRVKQARLDSFLDLVGELVTARNALLHLQRLVETEDEVPDLARHFKLVTTTLNRTVSQLQADVLSLRMVPVRIAFQRLTRVARDVAARQGKQADLKLVGEETEVDKTVADALVDPLVHLVRNAVDHGVEEPAARRAAGKPERGTVTLSAAREGNRIVLHVRDDGGGIDPARLRQVAVQKGVIRPEEADHLSDADALQLVFAAGFSTKAQVSDISGRGVGMDVVRSSVARIGGTVSVQSEPGHGTTFRLELPLTLSVFRALLVHAGAEAYAIPLDAVREMAAVTPSTSESLFGRQLATIGGELVGLVPLVEALGLGTQGAARSGATTSRMDTSLSVVVVEGNGERVGLIVDALDQPQEIMVKPLDAYLSAGGAIAGASVMGDGRVALVLEPSGIVRLALSHARDLAETTPPTLTGAFES